MKTRFYHRAATLSALLLAALLLSSCAPTPEAGVTPTPSATVSGGQETAAPTPTATAEPSQAATAEPTEVVTPEPTAEITAEPTEVPTPEPTEEVTPEPTAAPSTKPTAEPTATPAPTEAPTPKPTAEPTPAPTPIPTPAQSVSLDAAGLEANVKMFSNGVTAARFLDEVNAAITRWELAFAKTYGTDGPSDAFNWHAKLSDGKTVLETVKAEVLGALGVTQKDGTDAYKNFDYQVYYSRLIDRLGSPLPWGAQATA